MFSLLVIYKDGSDHPVMNTIWAVVKIKLENKFQACMGVKPMTSEILVQFSIILWFLISPWVKNEWKYTHHTVIQRDE